MLTAGSVPRLEVAGPSAAMLHAEFNDPRTLIVEGKGSLDRLLPQANPTMDCTSDTELADAFAAGTVPPTVTWVLLDLEDWPRTPPDDEASTPITVDH